MTTSETAPQTLHAALDRLYEGIVWARRIGMSGQIVLSIDKDGNLCDEKVNLHGVAKKRASA